MNGNSLKIVSPKTMFFVLYNPLPLDEVFTIRLSGMIKLGVGRDVAVDEDTYTFGFCNSFFSRYIHFNLRNCGGVTFSESCHVGFCDLMAERTFTRPSEGDSSRISVARVNISPSVGEYVASPDDIVGKRESRVSSSCYESNGTIIMGYS